MKLCIFTNSRELISNISIAFQTYSPECPNKAILVPNFFFWTIFCILENSRMLISNITIVFQIYGSKYPNKAVLVPFFVVAVIIVVVLLNFWYLDKLESANFKCGNSFSNFQSKITQIRHFWFQVWKLFVLHKILLNDIFEKADVKCDNNSSVFKPANNPKAFLFQI